jgi:helicase conserved domain protein
MNQSSEILTIQKCREEYIRRIEDSSNKEEEKRILSDNLFSLDLTMYAYPRTLQEILYKAVSKSKVDKDIYLHPEQLKILTQIKNNDALIVSAPTSFGKTFVIFEYIIRNKPNNVVLIVPTLALLDEYNKKILNKYKEKFKEYKIYLNIDENKEYDFTQKNIFILTHDRVVREENYSILKEIDFLVIDEVYKLQKDEQNDRILILNLAYYYLSNIAKKYVLLAPFIGNVENTEKLNKSPKLYRTDYSPVINDVYIKNISKESERIEKTKEIIKEVVNDKTLIYFQSVTKIYTFINQLDNEDIVIKNNEINRFIKWAEKEIHEEWYIVKALKKGYLVHNAQLPNGVKIMQLDWFENSKEFNKLLCTSTLLEGVNTTAKNIIITKPYTGGKNGKYFDAFDFFNLVGRSGRMNKHYLGNAYYIKGPEDKEYIKEDAIKNIEFEITQNSEDIEIHKNNYEENEEYKKLLEELNITHEEYKTNIGCRFRKNTIIRLYKSYKEYKGKLIQELEECIKDDKRGRLYLVRILYRIFENKDEKLETAIINCLLHRQRRKIKTTINEVSSYYSDTALDYLISKTIYLKSNYIEYEFYSKLLILIYIMEKEKIDEVYIDIINKKIKSNIDFLYYFDSKNKRILKDLGIYESDIEKIIEIVGEEFKDMNELKDRFIQNEEKIKKLKLSIVSKYIIKDFYK